MKPCYLNHAGKNRRFDIRNDNEQTEQSLLAILAANTNDWTFHKFFIIQSKTVPFLLQPIRTISSTSNVASRLFKKSKKRTDNCPPIIDRNDEIPDDSVSGVNNEMDVNHKQESTNVEHGVL